LLAARQLALLVLVDREDVSDRQNLDGVGRVPEPEDPAPSHSVSTRYLCLRLDP